MYWGGGGEETRVYAHHQHPGCTIVLQGEISNRGGHKTVLIVYKLIIEDIMLNLYTKWSGLKTN